MVGDIKMRKISDTFMNDLMAENGILHPILSRITRDHTLMLAIRKDKINIYYRGGNILRVEETGIHKYKTSFDDNYNRNDLPIPTSPVFLRSSEDTIAWVASFAERKNIMDEYFSIYGKAEREFQQLIARENNNSTVSNETEYFISDIEYNEPGARFDMMGIRWLAYQRQSGNNCKVALIEVKYGDGALGGDAGIIKHLQDMEKLVSNKEKYAEVLQTMQNQFDQLDQLGLVRYNKGISNARVKLNTDDKPEVIFILANHNPRSTKLQSILNQPEVMRYAGSDLFDLRFYTARFAGYALHSDCMLPMDDFIKWL